jgi:hypothetical protein
VEISDEHFQLVLLPTGDGAEILKTWEFRCDTHAELDNWVQAFQLATAMR